MSTELDQKIERETLDLIYKTPFTNAVSARMALGIPVPGVAMGSCAFLCGKLKERLASIPGVARLHRATERTGWSRRGERGNHVLVLKETEEGTRVIDPYLAHQRPFKLETGSLVTPSLIPSVHEVPTSVHFHFDDEEDVLHVSAPMANPYLGSPSLYKFYCHPSDEVAADGSESASRSKKVYGLRVISSDRLVAQWSYTPLEGNLLFAKGNGRKSEWAFLDGKGITTTRKEADRILVPYELDMGQVIDLLRSAPQWAEEFKRRQTEKH